MYERTHRFLDEAIRQLDDERRLIERELRALRLTRQAIRGSGQALRRVRQDTVRGLDRAGRALQAGARERPARKPGRRVAVKGVPAPTSARMIDAWQAYRAQRQAGVDPERPSAHG